MLPTHFSALADHYDHQADTYDAFNEEKSRYFNGMLTQKLKTLGIHSVLDFSCGTGSQLLWLNQKGFSVAGMDINQRMLGKAREKVISLGLAKKISLGEGDMRLTKVLDEKNNQKYFDCVISIFNAIGHLTKSDFLSTLRNVVSHLKPDGYFIFDIFNADYFVQPGKLGELTIDWQSKNDKGNSRKVQHSFLCSEEILYSETTLYFWPSNHTSKREDINSPITGEENSLMGNFDYSKTTKSTFCQTLQIYSPKTIKEILLSGGIKNVSLFSLTGEKLQQDKDPRMLVVARAD